MNAIARARCITRPATPESLPGHHHQAREREGRWGRLFRWLADRQHLKEMDSRMLHDIGLTPAAVRRGFKLSSAGRVLLGWGHPTACRDEIERPSAMIAPPW